MFRRELIGLLRGRMLPLTEIARIEKTRLKDLENDLEHLRRTLRREGIRLLVEPARCRKCDFVFREKLTKPGRCPKCKSTWIDEPQVGIEGGKEGGAGDPGG
jgi:predicted Zn-ribbon and HTH transcriptional regulator